jgi:L-iditol 2-dehydrogenase
LGDGVVIAWVPARSTAQHRWCSTQYWLDLSSPLVPLCSGAGPIGLVSLLAAKALGATPIIITDLFQSRLDFAKTLHPGVQTVLVERGQTAEEVAVKIREAAGGVELKFALECTGVESSIRTCIFVSRRDRVGVQEI